MATETLMNISRDWIEQARLTSELKNILDYQDGMVTARREGIQEGRMETARNALAKGLSAEYIHEITGLDIETIMQLQIKENK